MLNLPNDLRESFVSVGIKTVTNTDVNKAAYVVNQEQKTVFDTAGIKPGIVPNVTVFPLNVLFSDQILNASYYASIREGSNRLPEYRMGQFVNWLNVGDELLFATDGREVFVYKIPSEDKDVNADIKIYDTSIKDLESMAAEEQGTITEGRIRGYFGSRYERSGKNRASAIQIHGFACNVCGFDFEDKYGVRGAGFIEVHHIRPISTLGGEDVAIDPRTDLTTVCSNCHRIIHRDPQNVLSIDKVRALIKGRD